MTFSLVARCAETGMFGIAISSSSPAVAARCAYTRADVGAVASQNITDPRLGVFALDSMQSGKSASEAIGAVRKQGQFIDYRQVLAIDANGKTAIHSGQNSLGIWTDAAGTDVIAAGNLLANAEVPQAIVDGFEQSTGHLGDRLIAAMRAGLVAGGEAGPVVEKISEAELPTCAEIVLVESHIEKMLGLTIEASEVEEILVRLGMNVSAFKDEKGNSGWKVIAPSYRFDMAIEADLIEELARIYGYNRLPVRTPMAATPLLPVPENELAMKDVRRQLVGRGYQEAVTYSFVDPATQKLLDPEVAPLALANPISADLSVMRTNLWAGLVQTAVYNIKRQQPRVRLFETGLSFVPQPGKDPSNLDESLVQDPKLAMLLTGTRTEQSWSEGDENVDFFDLKGDFESLIARTGSQARYSFVPAEHPSLQPGQTARIELDGVAVGWIGALHPSLSKPLGLKQAVYLLEISLKAVRQVEVPAFKPLSKFPEMRRDLALVVTDVTPVADVMSLIREKAGDYLTKLNLFDIYQGKGIDPDRKSLALGLTWQHPSRTLNEEEVNEAVDNVLAHLADRIDAQLRG